MNRIRIALLVLAGAWMILPPARAQAPAGTGVTVRITVEKGARDIVLLRRKGPELQYRMPDAPPGVSATLNLDQVKQAEFTLPIEMPKVYQAMRRRQWAAAAQLIAPAVRPTLPWLDLPENNAVDPCILAGRCLVQAATDRRAAGDAAGADKFCLQAMEIYQKLLAAGWHPGSASAHLYGVVALVDAGRIPDAEREFARARKPEAGDAAFGMHGYARSRIADAQQKPREALESALGALIYETKDPVAFPGALLQAAQSYEDVNEFYRARDVYFEVARLFRGTPAGITARARLARLMEQGRTEAPETGNVAGVFFGTTEDMNQRCSEFLAATAGPEADDAPEEAPSKPSPVNSSPTPGAPAS